MKETLEQKAARELQEKFLSWNTEYANAVAKMSQIEGYFAPYGMKPSKPSTAKIVSLPEGLEDAVKEVLEGKTVTAGTFDKYLRKTHEMYGSNEPLKARKALIAAGVIKQLNGQGDKGNSNYVHLADEAVGEPVELD